MLNNINIITKKLRRSASNVNMYYDLNTKPSGVLYLRVRGVNCCDHDRARVASDGVLHQPRQQMLLVGARCIARHDVPKSHLSDINSVLGFK